MNEEMEGEWINTIRQNVTYQKNICSFTSQASPSPDPNRSLGSRWSSCDSRERAFWEWTGRKNGMDWSEWRRMWWREMECLESGGGWCEWEEVNVQAGRQAGWQIDRARRIKVEENRGSETVSKLRKVQPFTCVMKVGKLSSALIIFSNISSLLRLLDGK